MYNPSLGRWMTADPIGYEAGDQNLYRSVGNNPINQVDPSGLQPPGLGGNTTDIPEKTIPNLGRLGTPPSKADSLGTAPIRRKGDIATPPKGAQKHELGGGRTWSGGIPDGWLVGAEGCGPCVGLILIPPYRTMKTHVFHFNDSSDILAVLNILSIYGMRAGTPGNKAQRYKAIVFGCEFTANKDDQSSRLHTLDAVVRALKALRIEFEYVAAPCCAVDNKGTAYWTTPSVTPTDDYTRGLPSNK